ncbi:MAG: hypothetical protein JNL39_20690 [Opitutaceae bacterium]|nr:hypothetical protein [Opitutaceae bacterium]
MTTLLRKVRKGFTQMARATRAEWELRAGCKVTGETGFAVQAVRGWLRSLNSEYVPPVRGRILITALRNRTWIEWAGYCACVLRRQGWAATLLYRGTQTRVLYRAPDPLNFWARLSEVPDLQRVDLDTIEVDEEAATRLLVVARSAAPATLAYDLHVEETDIVGNPERHGAALAVAEQTYAHLGAALGVVLRGQSFTRFLCYSGLIAESPTLLAVAREHGLTTVCLENWGWRPGHMIYNLNAPALEYNVAGWLRAAGEWDATKEREVNAYLKFLDGGKATDAAWLDNFYRIQRDKVDAALPVTLREFLRGGEPVFVLAPNVIGDSSLLRRETIFPGQQAWMLKLIQWFAERPNLKLVIRAHPAELWMGAKCSIHMGDVARAAASGAGNVHVLGSEDDVNTFSLVPYARAGLAWVSSAGVEFVVRGLPAIAAAAPKYGGLGIVEEPPTVDDYFASLQRHASAAGVERPKPEQIFQGKRYLHMVFKGFSFEATGRNFLGTGCVMGAMPNQPEHDRFYRILVGDEPMPDVVAEADA